MLAAIPGVTCLEPQGAFYCFPSFEGVLGRELAGRTPTTTLELCELLLEEAKVAIVPGEAFGAPGYARLVASRWATTPCRGRRAHRQAARAVATSGPARRAGCRAQRRLASIRCNACSSPSSSPRAGSRRCAPPGSRSTCGSGSRPSELLDAVRGRVGAGDPQRDAGHGRGARGRRRAGRRRAAPGSVSTTSTSRPPPAAA